MKYGLSATTSAAGASGTILVGDVSTIGRIWTLPALGDYEHMVIKITETPDRSYFGL